MKKLFTFSLLLILCVFCLKAQTPRTVIIEPNIGFLDDLIMADTLANGQRKDLNTVYVLRRDATYLIQGVFENKGWPLNIKAETGTGKKPYVRPFPMVDGTLNGRLFTLSGAGKFENIYFDGEGEDASLKPVTIMFYSSYVGLKLELEGCIVANAGQAGLQIFAATEYVKVNNSRFFNMGRMAFNDFGNGRVFDARDSQYGLISFTNCTFVNNVDRIIRHRNNTGVIKQLIFDHNTIVNSINYHGFMELGHVGKSVQITNNLMVDCMGLGADQTDVTRLSELNAHGEKDALGNNKMVWVGSMPNDTTSFTINRNVYTITTAQQSWYTSVSLTEGPILTNHIQAKLGAGVTTAWQKKSFTLPNIPAPPVDFYKFYWAPTPTGAGKTKITTSVVDYDKKNTDYWLNTLNCKYSATDPDYIGTDGVPVGDPNWGSSVVQRTVIIEPNIGFLDDLIMADTLANGQRKDLNTVYVLRRGAAYLIQGVFENKGWPLNMKAEAGTGKRPYVRSFPQEDGTLSRRLFTLSGNGKFENIYFDGEGEDATLNPPTIIFYSSYVGLKLELEGCIVTNAGQAALQMFAATEYVKVNNCRFLNIGRMAFADFGNGRVLDARDSQFGLISFTNCTFINNVDRIIRHRNNTGVIKQLIFDHNTIVNSINYHGFMELGHVGKSVQITNNLMVDCMGLGADQTDVTRLSELNAHGEKDALGNNKMVWVGSMPNDTTSFSISNNVYTITTAQQAWYTSVSLTEGPILTNHIQAKLGAGAATAWQKKSFTLSNIPAPPVDFYKFYWAPTPTGAGKTKITTAVVDYDKKNTDYWLNTLNCKYTATDPAFRGKDGVPVGDPNWGSVVTGIEDRRNSGFDLVSYPNPFSDHTTLRFKTEQYSEVKIEIFDISGKVVRHIDAGTFAPGENTFVIQRTNMVSGIYLLRLNAGHISSFSKLIVK